MVRCRPIYSSPGTPGCRIRARASRQVGEDAGLSPAGAGEDGGQIFIATAVLLIAATPILYNLAIKMGTRVWERVESATATTESSASA